MNALFLDPVDILLFRGNRLFGDPGSHGDALVPPWPSVVAGALRSRMLVDEGIDLTRFAANQIDHPELGSPAQPGPFVVTGLYLARLQPNSPPQECEILMAAPSDLVIAAVDRDGQEKAIEARLMQPQRLHPALQHSGTLPLSPVLPQGSKRTKPTGGYWLTQQGWQQYLHGMTPTANQLVPSNQLWLLDDRVGVGLDPDTRSAKEGQLFTVQAVSFQQGIGLMVTAEQASLPQHGLLRLGGDGRAVHVVPVSPNLPTAKVKDLLAHRRCRLVLTTPGVFGNGWLPNGFEAQGNGEIRLNLHGVRGRLVTASIGRSEVISGWDLARRRPKPAERVVPTGSVYWLDELETTPEALAKLVDQGLWSTPCEDPQRRAEGFNRLVLAPWAGDQTKH